MFTCIIPFYNEGVRPLTTLKIISRVELITQIVCVDDGSTDGTAELVKKEYPQTDLTILPKNGGKAQAVFWGVKKAVYENIVLIDADLLELQAEELRAALSMYLTHQPLDMLILENRSGSTLAEKIHRKNIFLSGKRILKKSDLTEILASQPSGYQLETAINAYMISQKRTVSWIANSARNPRRVEKIGFFKGLESDLKTEASLIKFAGFFGYLQQMFLFCRQELRLKILRVD